jgi:transmembrane sensor
MSLPDLDPIKSASVRARAEAAGWLAKLHGPSRTAIVESAWRHWLAEHEEHAAAWELATDTWADTDNLPFVLPRRPVPKSRVWLPHLMLRPIAAAAAICLILAGVTIHYTAKPAVTTTFGEQRTLNLPDGTRVELNTNTRLVLQFNNRTRTVELQTGEAYFNVAHERRPFVVIAGLRKIIAVGTSFLVRRNEAADNSVTVTLIEGRVAVAPVNAPDILPSKPTFDIALLSAGKRLQVAQHTAPTIDTPSVDQETAWMRGQLIFHDTPLRDAVAEFNRYSTMQIKFTSAAIGEISVGGVFRIGDSASFAAAVAQSHDLRLITQDDELVLVSLEDTLPR